MATLTANVHQSGATSDENRTPAGLALVDFDYPLPLDRIAQQPLTERDQSRMLVLGRSSGQIIAHSTFSHLTQFLNPGDLLILNETKVNALRLQGTSIGSGGSAEFLLTHRIHEGLWQALAKPGKRLREGARVDVSDGLIVEVIEIVDERGARLVKITLDGKEIGTDAAIEAAGTTPLPPYIHSDDPNQHRERYQTVYATSPGSAAAPTAGLHFTPNLLQQLRDFGIEIAKVTLHVGIGTFRPIESSDITQHVMHFEQGFIPDETAQKIQAATGRVVAVGTTSVRSLESMATGNRLVRSGSFRTDLYITPGHTFKIVDAMITNFHMPRSTLLVLVAAFAGRTPILNAYADAIIHDYRFLSFGDSMLIIDPVKADSGR